MLPLGFGWSLWIHLFVQYPRLVSTVLLIAVLAGAPAASVGLSEEDHSIGWEVLQLVFEASTIMTG